MRVGWFGIARLLAMVIVAASVACSHDDSPQPTAAPVTLTSDQEATARRLVENDPTLSRITNGSPATVGAISPWRPNAEFTSADAPSVPGIALVNVTFAHPQTINADVPSGNCDGTHFVGGRVHLIVTTPISGLSVVVDTNGQRVLAFTTAGNNVMGVSPDIPGTSTPYPEVACHFGPRS